MSLFVDIMVVEVKAAMGNQSIGIIDNWIRHIKDVYRLHNGYLDSIEDETERFNAFVEINAKEQVYDLSKTSQQHGRTDKI
jgi:carbonic anhydrase